MREVQPHPCRRSSSTARAATALLLLAACGEGDGPAPFTPFMPGQVPSTSDAAAGDSGDGSVPPAALDGSVPLDAGSVDGGTATDAAAQTDAGATETDAAADAGDETDAALDAGNAPTDADADASNDAGATPALPETTDPGDQPWQPVPRDEVAAVCGLDPDLLDQADAILNRRWAVVRYGRLCHEFYPGADDASTTTEVFSTTKTLGAVVTGRVMYETRDLPESGPRTGPLEEFQRVDRWLDIDSTTFDIHPDATIAHVLAMVAYSDDLSFGQKVHAYDADGSREINSLSDILNAAIAQDSERLGDNLEEFTQRFLFEPMGMASSTWTGGAPDKVFGYTWNANVRDMLRLGLLVNNGGVWNGERLVSAQYLYNMTHPAFEDANTGYGYLTWLNAADHRIPFVSNLGKTAEPYDGCAPLTVHRSYPHGISQAPDCNYESPGYSCEQTYDVGPWAAQGLNGHYIYGHRGLSLVMAVQDLGVVSAQTQVWDALRPALLAHDPVYTNDEEGFCEAYAAGEYAPDLQPWEGGL